MFEDDPLGLVRSFTQQSILDSTFQVTLPWMVAWFFPLRFRKLLAAPSVLGVYCSFYFDSSSACSCFFLG